MCTVSPPALFFLQYLVKKTTLFSVTRAEPGTIHSCFSMTPVPFQSPERGHLVSAFSLAFMQT